MNPANKPPRFAPNDKVSAWDDHATDARGFAVRKFGRVVKVGPRMILVRWEGRTKDRWVYPWILALSAWPDDPADPFPVPPVGA